MFKQILIPLDGSSLAECVLPHALALSRANHPKIHLLRIIDPYAAENRLTTIDPFEWNFRKVEAETYLKNITTQFSEAGIDVEVHTGEGKPADTIIEYAQNRRIDLILLSSHGKSGLTGWNVSSVVQKVILRVRTSIMLIRAYQPTLSETEFHYKRILLPLDGSQRAESVFQVAEEIGRAHSAEVLAAHIIQQPEMPRRKPLSPEDIELSEKIIDRNRAEATEYLAELKHRFNLPLETHLFVDNKVASSLHKFVEKENIDLVMLTAHGVSGETNWPYGNVVTSFIAYGITPLLVYQDLSPENIRLTQAEEAARVHGER